MTPERKALRAANSAIERKLTGGEFHPPPCIPEPTADLSEAERTLWEELGNRLFSFGLISSLDSVTFHMLVTGTIRYQQLRAELAGLAITNDKAASVERRLLMQRKELAQLAA